MKKLKSLFLVAIILATFNLSQAQNKNLPELKFQIQGNGIPAKPEQISYKQPDGSLISLNLKGDAVIHWAVSSDGYTLLSNSNGFYEYAKLDFNGDLVSTGVIARDENKRSTSDITLLNSIPKGINFSDNQISQKISTYKSSKSNGNSVKSFPSTGTQNFLVLMVEFSDVTFSNTVTDFDNLMNQSNYGGIGSFQDFYYQNSYGLLTVNTLVDGIYQATNTHDYYGQNDGDGNDMNVGELISSIIVAAEDYIDFTQFDNDGDGVVDAVYVIYAGTGEASSGNANDIWPHASSITPITVDGVTVEGYACSNELAGGYMVGIGTICHEFGHSLSLPDFYDTDYSGSGGQAEGTGSWDCMAGGAYNGNEASPACHNPISKELLGWMSSTKINENGFYVVQATTQNDIAYLVEDITATEGFYLENRQWEGFDYELPGHGMLIYHCDYDYFASHLYSNDINNDPYHQGFDLEEADGEIYSEGSDAFPGSSSNTSFTDNSNPSSVLWSGYNLGYPIENIAELGGNIQFNIDGFLSLVEKTNNNVQVFPTIANDFISIISNELISKIEIINIQGQVVQNYLINNNQIQLNIRDLKNGTYFIKTSTNNGTSVSKIIVIR